MSRQPPPNPFDTFITCESVAAVTVHIRAVTTATPIGYGGYHPRPKSLCDREVAWDTKLPLDAARCKSCIEVMANLVSEGLQRGR